MFGFVQWSRKAAGHVAWTLTRAQDFQTWTPSSIQSRKFARSPSEVRRLCLNIPIFLFDAAEAVTIVHGPSAGVVASLAPVFYKLIPQRWLSVRNRVLDLTDLVPEPKTRFRAKFPCLVVFFFHQKLSMF